jgi:peptidoglycan hydrolase CwlO-like protein
MQLENEVSLLDNNIGFFASSKNADSMIADVRKKISKTKEEIRKLEEKIKLIDKEFE